MALSRLLRAASLIALSSAASCGGSGGGSNDVVLTPVLEFDGTVTKSGYFDTSGPEIFAGEYFDNPHRGVVGFDLGEIPAGAAVVKATLVMNQFDVRGVPYDDLGMLVLDHVDLGVAVDASDYDSSALDSAFAVLSTSPVEEDKEADVTDQVAYALFLGLPRVDFRLRFTTESDGEMFDEDLVGFPTAENSPPATLTVKLD